MSIKMKIIELFIAISYFRDAKPDFQMKRSRMYWSRQYLQWMLQHMRYCSSVSKWWANICQCDTTNTNLKVSLSVSRHYSYADRLNCNFNITTINLSRCEFNYFIKCIEPIERARGVRWQRHWKLVKCKPHERFKIQIGVHKIRQGLSRFLLRVTLRKFYGARNARVATMPTFEVWRYFFPFRDLSDDALDKNRRSMRQKYMLAPVVYRYVAVVSKEYFYVRNPDCFAFIDVWKLV